MSRSNPTESTNPAQRFFRFDSTNGKFQYYDKAKKENISVPLPFRFIVLDTLSTIGGYSSTMKTGFWSNEVRNTIEDKLKVKTKQGVFAEGYYQDFSDSLKAEGGKFVQSVYIAYKSVNKQLIIANVKFIGSNLSKWIEFVKENRASLLKEAVIVRKAEEETNGSNTYQVPVFALTDVAEKTNNQAIELDKELQEHLTTYLEQPAAQNPSRTEMTQLTTNTQTRIATPPSEAPLEEMAEDDLPF